MVPSLPILRHVAHESAGTLENVLAEMGLDFHYIDLFERAPDRLELADVPGLVILGGPMNVDDVEKYPYLASEVEWIRQALTAGLPTLGICLGAQLLAKALGAKVYPNRVKEIGWYRIDLTPYADRDPLFKDGGKRITVFHWHGDTFDMPRGAVRLAQGPHCRNQAFRYGRSAYGLQFHIEMTAELIEAWLSESVNCGELAGLNYIDPRKIREQTPTDLPVLEALADKVLGRFVRLCWDKTRRTAKCRDNACR
jgi:GMP synthase (glutamine-hydrolysing)